MDDPGQLPVLASVLYLRLAEFGRQPVAAQARWRTQLDAAANLGLGGLAPADRVVLEASDGLVVVVLGNPPGALRAAEQCLQAGAGLPLAIGANHGPIALSGVGGEAPPSILGDGIRAAATAAGFANPGQILATRVFRDALAADAPVRSAEMCEAGVFHDASVRTHELYRIEPDARTRRRRRLHVAGAVGALVLAAIGAVLGDRLPGFLLPPAELVLQVEPGGELFVDGEFRGHVPPLDRLSLPPGLHAIELRRDDALPMTREIELKSGEPFVLRHVFPPPARVLFEIAPDGEVFVGGKALGPASALQPLKLRPGAHAVEVRREGHEPLTLELELEAGQEAVVRHAFIQPAVLVLDIKPDGGELFVNGEARGTLPQDQRVTLSPGRHLIEVRHARYATLHFDVTLKEGEEATIRHEFGAKGPGELFRKLKKTLGFDQ